MPGVPNCITTLGSENGPCGVKINNAPGNQVTATYVIKSQDQNRSWDIAFSARMDIYRDIQNRCT